MAAGTDIYSRELPHPTEVQGLWQNQGMAPIIVSNFYAHILYNPKFRYLEA